MFVGDSRKFVLVKISRYTVASFQGTTIIVGFYCVPKQTENV